MRCGVAARQDGQDMAQVTHSGDSLDYAFERAEPVAVKANLETGSGRFARQVVAGSGDGVIGISARSKN